MKKQFVLIVHEISDYQIWKRIFDEASTIRREAGELSYQILSCSESCDKIVHFSNWISIEQAKRFFESPELIKIREAAGVKSPEFIYLFELENGTL